LKTSGHFVVSARVCHTASHDARWELRTLTLKRSMAAEYSRELSVQVFSG